MQKIVFSSVILGILLAISTSAHAAERYVVQGDGSEMLDTQTQLVWQRCAVGMVWSSGMCMGNASNLSLHTTFSIAKSLASTSGKAWRVPNIRELSSLAEHSTSNPAINAIAFPNTPSVEFMTSSPYQSAYYGSTLVWTVDFYYGDGTQQKVMTDTGALRLVRFP